MLSTLPDELLVEIFSYLSIWEDFPRRRDESDDDDADAEDEEVRNEVGADEVSEVEGSADIARADDKSEDEESEDEESEDDGDDEYDYEDYEDTISFPRLNPPGIEALARLCRVSKGIRALAEPFLYQNFIKWPNYYADPTDFLGNTLYNIRGTERFRGFLSAIMQRPELAASVRAVVLWGWDTEDVLNDESGERTFMDNAPVPANRAQVKLYLARSSQFSLGACHDDWVASLCRGYEDAEVALLLLLCHRLKRLHVSFSATGGSLGHRYYFNDVFRRAVHQHRIGHQPILKNLEEIHVRNFCPIQYTKGLPLFAFHELLTLPSTTTFHAYYVEQWTPMSSSLNTSNIQHLSLHDCSISNEALYKLLLACARIRSFHAKFIVGDRPDGYTLTWPGVATALAKHHKTLERLSVEMFDEYQFFSQQHEEGECQPIPSLREFTALTHLRVNELAFVAKTMNYTMAAPPMAELNDEVEAKAVHEMTDRLPTAIQSLTILQPTEHMYAPLDNLQEKTGEFPHLREIVIEGNGELYADIPSLQAFRNNVLDDFKEDFGKSGVSFLVPNPT